MTKTVYPAGVPIHFYSKSIDGQGIFYRTEDKLVFLTSLSCIVRKYDLDVISFCLMFNHFHLLVKVKSCSHTLKAIAEFKKNLLVNTICGMVATEDCLPLRQGGQRRTH